MGNARWSNTAFSTYASSTGYQTKSVREVFDSCSVKREMDPRDIALRESCDSENNPNSTPIILGLDVTGSMGRYAREIAVTHLPRLMSSLLDSGVVSDPQLMFMGIDDIHTGMGMPLQVSQFEADIKILEQLRELFLVGGGGGNDSESYDLAWLFAAYYTKIDSFDKRGKPGYLFTFGDECAPYQQIFKGTLDSTFKNNELNGASPIELLTKAQEKYQVFHIVIEQGSYCEGHSAKVKNSWTELLGNNVFFLSDTNYLTELVIAILEIAGGKDIHDVINNSGCKDQLTHAFQNALK